MSSLRADLGYRPLKQEPDYDRRPSWRSVSSSSTDSSDSADSADSADEARYAAANSVSTRRVRLGLWLSLKSLVVFTSLVALSPYRLTIRRVYTCPDPYVARPDSLTVSRHRSEPFEIPSILPEFSMSIVHDTTVCNAFELTISRLDKEHCAFVEANERPSKDDMTTAFAKKYLGPDQFATQIDGAERIELDTPTEYLGNCEYLYRFRLSNGGPIWMNVTHNTRNYLALEEVDPKPDYRQITELLQMPLLREPVQLDLCDASCPTHLGPRLGFDVPPVFPSTSPLALAEKAHADLPSCHDAAVAGTLEGSYIPAPLYDLVYPAYPIPYSMMYNRTTSGQYEWVPQGCRWRHDGVRFSNRHETCWEKPHKAFLVGDSHSRALYDIVTNRFDGDGSIAIDSVKMDEKAYSRGGLSIDYHWDPFLESVFTCEEHGQYDSIATSVGTHQGAWRYPYTEQLVEELDLKLGNIADMARKCHGFPPLDRSDGAPDLQHFAANGAEKSTTKLPTLIYLNLPAQAQHHLWHDMRTGPRITYWNNRLRAVAERNGFTVIDVEGYTAPGAIDQRNADGIHCRNHRTDR
ncbi:hypothetical protein Rhopal_007516-T1 [Rhodotorula paludigena]|uniref:Uncharacterized protein n=1 Tax=Rhodotorula paludigena TaxID=86838 RepID=A0AAV5GY59_9BASI|nr:hypothetical protein Rhopal_007516-T1 [Rhodotorula paludigena]